MYSIMISAGEASGDAHAAHALDALRRQGISFESFGMGATQLEAHGTELLVDASDLSVIGFVDVLLNYHRFVRRLRLLRKALRQRRPDLLVLVDFPDFNLKLAETARALNIPVLFYVSPQLWAWRANRIHRIGRLVDHMAVLFPFEVPYYERENIPVTYVGNPVVEQAHCELNQLEARQALGLSGTPLTVGLLPGSRRGELRRLLPIMLEAAALLDQRFDAIQFVLPRAASLDSAEVAAIIGHRKPSPRVIDGQATTVMRACDAIMVASGTATLETALIGTPMVLIYKISALNYAIMRRLIRISDIGLVNIVAGRRIVPELLQRQATAERLAKLIGDLIDYPDNMQRMKLELAEVRQKMGDGHASERVAGLMVSLLASGPTA